MSRSKTVMEQRKAAYDRVSTLIDKGGKYLLRAQAIREGVSVAEMLRRAVCARAGLRIVPYADDLEALSKVRTREEAKQAIIRLQQKEEAVDIMFQVLQELAPEPDEALYTMSVDYDTRKVLLRMAGLSDADILELVGNDDDVEVSLSGWEIGHIRRLLANMEGEGWPDQRA